MNDKSLSEQFKILKEDYDKLEIKFNLTSAANVRINQKYTAVSTSAKKLNKDLKAAEKVQKVCLEQTSTLKEELQNKSVSIIDLEQLIEKEKKGSAIDLEHAQKTCSEGALSFNKIITNLQDELKNKTVSFVKLKQILQKEKNSSAINLEHVQKTCSEEATNFNNKISTLQEELQNKTVDILKLEESLQTEKNSSATCLEKLQIDCAISASDSSKKEELEKLAKEVSAQFAARECIIIEDTCSCPWLGRAKEGSSYDVTDYEKKECPYTQFDTCKDYLTAATALDECSEFLPAGTDSTEHLAPILFDYGFSADLLLN